MPPAQAAGVLLNAIFLDLLDADALRVKRLNALSDRLPREARDGLRRVDLLILRPSQDLGRLANEFEAALPRTFRFLVRGLGSRETRSNDMLSLLMFQPDYIAKVIDLGESDARARSEEIEAFIRGMWNATSGSHHVRSSHISRSPPKRTTGEFETADSTSVPVLLYEPPRGNRTTKTLPFG